MLTEEASYITGYLGSFENIEIIWNLLSLLIVIDIPVAKIGCKFILY